MPHGRAFVVTKPQLFATNVLPRYFKQTKYLSFTRQLNLWGYKRITRGLDAGAYYHELFLRCRPSLARWMKRIKIKGNTGGMKLMPNPIMEPNFYTNWPPIIVDCNNNNDQQQRHHNNNGDGNNNDQYGGGGNYNDHDYGPPLTTNYNIGRSSSSSSSFNGDGNIRIGGGCSGRKHNVEEDRKHSNNKKFKLTTTSIGRGFNGIGGNGGSSSDGTTIGSSFGGRGEGGMNNNNISDSVMLSVLLQQEQERDDVAAAINGIATLADASATFLPSPSLYTTGGGISSINGSSSSSSSSNGRHQAKSSNDVASGCTNLQNYSTSTMGLPSYLQADSAMLSALLRRERAFAGGVGGSIQQLGQPSNNATSSSSSSSSLQNYASVGIPSFLQGVQQQIQHLPHHMMLSSRGGDGGKLVGGRGPSSPSLSSRNQQLESFYDDLMRSQLSSNALFWGGRGSSQFQQQQHHHHHNMMMPMGGGRNFDPITFSDQFTSASARGGGGGGLQHHQQHISSSGGGGGSGRTTATTNTAMESLGLMGSLQHSTNATAVATFAREMENKMHNDLAALICASGLHQKQQHSQQQQQHPVSVASTAVGTGNGAREMIPRPQHHQQQQQQLSSDRLLMERLRNLDKLKQVKSDFDTLLNNNNPSSSPLPLTTTTETETPRGGSMGNSSLTNVSYGTNTDIHSSLMHALREADHLEKLALVQRAKARSLAVAGAWSQLGDGVIGDGVGGGGDGGGLMRSPSASSLATMTQSLPGHHTSTAAVDEKWRQLLHVMEDASVTEGVTHH